jgi:hypothetical protein
MTLHQLPDHGFADADAALVAVRRMKLRQKLRDARASIARALEHLDVVAQPDRGAAPASSDQRVDLTVGGGKGYVGEVGFFDRDSQRMRERELLEGLDAVNELLDLAVVEIGHGLFSSKRGSASAAVGGEGQSLCRGAEKTPPESGAGGAA